MRRGAGTDDAGHGAHVAGIVAAATNNGQGVAGVAPGARILGIQGPGERVQPRRRRRRRRSSARPRAESPMSPRGAVGGRSSAAVINLSLGNEAQAIIGPGDDFAAALDYAWGRGSIPVLVAGNDLLLPGSLVDVPAVIVAATTADTRAAYSNGVGNVRWAVAAPGGEADSGSTCESGRRTGSCRPTTGRQASRRPARRAPRARWASMAAPHVSGALAVLRSAGLGPQEAVDRLLATADDLGTPGRDNSFGSGRINLARAVDGLSAAGAGPAIPVGNPSTTAPAPPPHPARRRSCRRARSHHPPCPARRPRPPPCHRRTRRRRARRSTRAQVQPCQRRSAATTTRSRRCR